jgi:hypothetical protein
MPQRRAALAAKAIVVGVVATVVGTVSVFVAFFAGQAVLQGKHIGVALAIRMSCGPGSEPARTSPS